MVFINSEKIIANLLKYIKIYCLSTKILKEIIFAIFHMVGGGLVVFSNSEKLYLTCKNSSKFNAFVLKYSKKTIFAIF